MISVAVLVAIVRQCLFLSLFCALQYMEYLFISVNCNTEFWSLSSDSLRGYKRPRDSFFFFELGHNGSVLGLMIFHKMSPGLTITTCNKITTS